MFKVAKTTSKSTKSPLVYMHEMKALINDLAGSDDVQTRYLVAEHSFTPSGILKGRLLIETDKVVLKALLLNVKVGVRAMKEFGEKRPDVANQFVGDVDIFGKLSK
jgi:hypothetical protein